MEDEDWKIRKNIANNGVRSKSIISSFYSLWLDHTIQTFIQEPNVLNECTCMYFEMHTVLEWDNITVMLD